MPYLSPYTKNPRYFQDPSGYPVYLCGVATPDLVHRIERDDPEILPHLADRDVNAIAVDLSAPDRDPGHWIGPYKRSAAGGRGPLGFRRFDLSAPNPAYWARLTSLLKQSRRSGLFVLLRLFPETLGGSVLAGASAWNPAHNVNGEGGFDDSRLREFLESAAEATGSFPNVLFQVGEGLPEPLQRCALEWLCSGVRAPILTTDPAIGGMGSATVVDDSAADPIRAAKGRAWVALDGDPAAPGGVASARGRAWRAFLRGAAGAFLEPGGAFLEAASGEGEAPRSAVLEEAAGAAGAIRRFIRERRVPYWKMTAGSTDDTDSPRLFRPNDRYLAMPPGPGEAIALDLSGDGGVFTSSWWHVEHELLQSRGIVLGGAMQRFIPPDSGEWILDLYKRVN